MIPEILSRSSFPVFGWGWTSYPRGQGDPASPNWKRKRVITRACTDASRRFPDALAVNVTATHPIPCRLYSLEKKTFLVSWGKEKKREIFILVSLTSFNRVTESKKKSFLSDLLFSAFYTGANYFHLCASDGSNSQLQCRGFPNRPKPTVFSDNPNHSTR